MSRSGEKFIQHRDEEAQREAQELAAREAYYLGKRLKDRNVEQTARDRAQKPKR